MKILLFVLTVTLVLPAFGQRKNKDEEIIEIPTYTEGIVYSLPRTGIRIYVTAFREKFQPGPYSAYADQLLGITDAKTKSSVKWILEDVRMETFSEPDPNQVYKAMGEAASLVSLTPEGCLAGINTNLKGKDMKSYKANSFIPFIEKNDGFSFANINDSPLYTSGDSTNNFRPVRIGVEQKAAEAAGRILESRRIQYDMVAGMMDEFHPDGASYKVSLKELKKIETEYLQLFTGRTTYKSQSLGFDFVPTSSAEKGEVIFRFSDENGVVPASDLSGKPVMLKIEAIDNLVKEYKEKAPSKNPAAGERGVYYRMPGMASVELIYELKTIATMRTLLAQFGVVAPFPEDLLLGNYSIEIHPQTGAIKSVYEK